MKQRTINHACLLLAVAGISFGVGQASGPEPAESANSNRAVVKELKKLYRLQFDSQVDIAVAVRSTDRKLGDLNDTIGQRLGGKTVRELLRQICAQGTNFPSTYC